MNIEEAKANIGKEVVYIGSINRLINLFSGGTFLIASIHANGDLVVVESGDFILTVEPQHLQLKHSTYKVGDQVVLDESTKPYTLTNSDGGASVKAGNPIDNHTYAIIGIGADGDVHLADYGWIQPRHLKLAPQSEDQDFLKGDPVINGIHADIHNAMKGEHKELLKLVINGKEIKDFNADEEVIINSKVKYHSEEMRKYRDEVAQTLLEHGVPLDKDFKNKIDLYINAVTTK